MSHQGRWGQTPWISIPSTLMTDSRLSAADLRVFMAIIAHLPNTGEQVAWPSRRRLADMTGSTTRTVERSLSRLAEFGYLTIEERVRSDGGATSNLYTVTVPQIDDIPVEGGVDEIVEGGSTRLSTLELDQEELDVEEPEGSSTRTPAIRGDIGVLPIWDALITVFGEIPDSQRGRYGRIVRDLSNLGHTGDDVLHRASVWPMHFPTATLTPEALLKFWGQLGRPPLRLNPQQQKEYAAQMTGEDRASRRARLLERLESSR